MSSTLKDLIATKRKKRSDNKAQDETENNEENSNKLIQGISSIIQAGQTNDGYVNDEDNQQENSTKDTIVTSQASQSSIVNKHRDRSREISKNIQEEDQNVIVEQLKDVRERIKDKLKSNIIDNLVKVREEEETSKKEETNKEDLKLDLTSSTKDDNLGTLLSGTDNSIKERIKRIQQRAGEKSNYRLIGSARRETTRFDETDIKADEDKKKLERIQEAKAKRKFQKLGQSVLEEIHLPNQEEQLDFFVKTTWAKVDEHDDITEPQKEKKPKTKDGETAADDKEPSKEEKDSEKAPLIIQMDDWNDLIYTKANYKTHALIKEEEKKVFFMPSAANVPINKKLGENVKARLLENEGLYIGRKPYVKIKNKNLMENRMLKFPDSRGLKWFGPDGEIIALPDPIKYISTRPSINAPFIEGLDTNYRKAIYLEDFANNLLVERGSLNTINVAKYRIDLDINQLQFSYHYLFSEEHVLAFKLNTMYDHYKITEEQNLIEILTERIKALKEALNRFSNELSLQSSRLAADRKMYIESTSSIIKSNNQSDNDFITSSDANQLKAYKNEIKQARQQRDIEMKLKKNLIEKIIATWKDLKDIRNKQQFRNTDLKLIIKKKEVNKAKEEKIFDKDLNDEFEEILAEVKEEYESKISEYNKKNKTWKFQQTKKNEARKRQEEREKERSNPKPAETLNITQITQNKEMEDNDLKILNEEDLQKPIKPDPIDENKIYESLRAHFTEIRKLPGEPIILFDLINESGSISPANQCSQSEQTRRNKLAKTKVYIKIFLNGKLVFTTNECQLQSDFSVRWAQIFNIYMISYTDSVHFQIYDYYDSKSRERLLAEIDLPSPDPNCTSSNYSLEDFEFSSTEPFYMHIKSTNQIELFYTCGMIRTGAGWGIDEKDGSVLVPPILRKTNDTVLDQEEIKNYDAIAALGVSRMQDMESLAKWIEKSNLDPNDPLNANLNNLIRTITESDGIKSTFSGFRLPDYFRLDQMIQEYNFASEEDIERNKRYRLIMLRAQNEPEFRGYRMIPINERSVRKDQFDIYEKRKIKDLAGDDEEEKTNDTIRSGKFKDMENEIEMSRARGQKIVRRIREQILKQFKFTQSQKTLSDMIIEEQVPNINALGSLFYSLYVEPRRPLYPQRRERKKIKGQNVSPDDVYILVNVVNANDLPVRKEKLSNDPMKVIKDPNTGRTIKVHEHIAGESLVRPYVQVTFQETVYRTSTADGPNASWNQAIYLPFKAPNNDLRPESLQTCKDSIYINVFDEVIVDVLEDDRDRENTIHKKIQRYWLGTLKIPFSTIYFKSKIEGTFKLETPSVMLGYAKDSRLSQIQSVEATYNIESPLKESSYLSLYLTIEPALLVPDAYRENYDSIESKELLDKSVSWVTDYNKKFDKREFRPIVMNTEGKSVLVTRYFRAIKPPEELIEKDASSFETAYNVARYVNLIPFVSDSLIFPGICDIWSTCDQFMEILSGDEEEHSVLLVNFFLGLGKKAWLLVGSSITNGFCCYALTIENGDYTIWYNGQPFKVNEPHNPVRVVSGLINADNMWLNVQQFDEPFRIKYNVDDAKLWRPFFEKSNKNKFESIQPEALIFKTTDSKFVKDLEIKIESKLRDKLTNWRPRYITKIHRYVSGALRQILSTMEKSHRETLSNQKEPEELEQYQKTYRISGFPINLPYSNMNSIFEAVYATQVHSIPTNDVEFALAVCVVPYPNTILSVWIYVASLIRKS